jgi:hypothetical protein
MGVLERDGGPLSNAADAAAGISLIGCIFHVYSGFCHCLVPCSTRTARGIFVSHETEDVTDDFYLKSR